MLCIIDQKWQKNSFGCSQLSKAAVSGYAGFMEFTRICFTGGGSGGHVYPAKPLIDAFRQQWPSVSIDWLGSKDGIEASITSKWGLQYYAIPSGKLRRYFSMKNFTDVFRIMAAFFKARKYLKRHRPDFLFSKGGFVSVPGVWAAKSLSLPVYSHDSDVDPGLATRINARSSRKIFIPYKESLKYYGKWMNKTVEAGNPVRRIFFKARAENAQSFLAQSEGKPILLVIGGSLGAREINKWVEDSLDLLCKHFYVVHQTGEQNQSAAQRDGYLPLPYIYDELPHLMKAASVAFSRAGANALWELTATETPMVLLPLTSGSRGDQPKNAKIFESLGFASVVDSRNLTPEILADTLVNMSSDMPGGAKAVQAMKDNPLPVAERCIMDQIQEDFS